MQTKDWRLADNDMDIADALLDRSLQEFINQDGGQDGPPLLESCACEFLVLFRQFPRTPVYCAKSQNGVFGENMVILIPTCHDELIARIYRR